MNDTIKTKIFSPSLFSKYSKLTVLSDHNTRREHVMTIALSLHGLMMGPISSWEVIQISRQVVPTDFPGSSKLLDE